MSSVHIYYMDIISVLMVHDLSLHVHSQEYNFRPGNILFTNNFSGWNVLLSYKITAAQTGHKAFYSESERAFSKKGL